MPCLLRRLLGIEFSVHERIFVNIMECQWIAKGESREIELNVFPSLTQPEPSDPANPELPDPFRGDHGAQRRDRSSTSIIGQELFIVRQGEKHQTATFLI